MTASTSATPRPPAERLQSLDALRGFDMFWIIGGAELVRGLLDLAHSPALSRVGRWVAEHAEWQGLNFYDLIFPLFLFIVGVAVPFSVYGRLERGDSKRRVAWRIVRRTLLLFALGLLVNGALAAPDFDQVRVMGVLQRLALGYAVAALTSLSLGPRPQAALAAVLLVGYWLILRFIPAPGYLAFTLTPEGNLAGWIDRQVFQPGQMYETWGDPEGLLSTIPALATALIGALAGRWLREPCSGERKTLGLIAAGLVCLAVGGLWSLDFPVIKRLWTSSYVLVAGGWSLLLLAAFYWTIDVCGWRRWAFVFVVIGSNAILIYLGSVPVDFFLGAALGWPDWPLPAWAALTLSVKAAILALLHSRRIYLRL